MARLETHNEAQDEANYRVALIMAEIRNSVRTKRSDKFWTASDIVGSPKAIEDDTDCDYEGIVAMFRGLRGSN